MGDLDVVKISHNAPGDVLPEDAEKEVGAFIPVNNDDDDYTATAADYGIDYRQQGAVNGEDDLLPIIVRAINDPLARVKLTTQGLRIYRNADRTQDVTNQEFAAPQQDLTLYVEAAAPGNRTITLSVNGQATKQTIKVTAFQWVGPLNVPQYGTYRYTVGSPPKGGNWIDPVNGNVEAGANTSQMDIFWAAGPVVGKAVYQAHADYIWDLGSV